MGGSASGNTGRAADSGDNTNSGIFCCDWTFSGWDSAGAGDCQSHGTADDRADDNRSGVANGFIKLFGYPVRQLRAGAPHSRTEQLTVVRYTRFRNSLNIRAWRTREATNHGVP